MNTPAGAAPAPLRTHPHHNRNLRTEHLFYNRARRRQQPAGGVELHVQRPSTVVFRPGDAFTKKVVHRRIDAAVDGDQIDMRRRGVLGLRRQDAGAKRDQPKQQNGFKRVHRASL
jgi:hypothetical protein